MIDQLSFKDAFTGKKVSFPLHEIADRVSLPNNLKIMSPIDDLTLAYVGQLPYQQPPKCKPTFIKLRVCSKMLGTEHQNLVANGDALVFFYHSSKILSEKVTVGSIFKQILPQAIFFSK